MTAEDIHGSGAAGRAYLCSDHVCVHIGPTRLRRWCREEGHGRRASRRRDRRLTAAEPAWRRLRALRRSAAYGLSGSRNHDGFMTHHMAGPLAVDTV